MIRITDILDTITDLQPDADLDLVDRAYVYSAKVHDGQKRLSGEPYLTHPLEVAGILANMNLDVVSIAAGLLHDVIEDTHATEEEIRQTFGPEVAHIVSAVTKISKLPFHTSEYREAESIRKMVLAMADDIRVIIVKLADRLHNMRTIGFHKKEEKKKKIAQETLDIYSPIASRLGIYWMKNELEDICFKAIDPESYEKLQSLVNTDPKERDAYVQKVKDLIYQKMQESNIDCEVMGRFKQPYSLYTKMKKQGLNFDQIYDLIAFRIITDSESRCYDALGQVHRLWLPVPGKFKDYIAAPKENGYQSLHTSVIGPYGELMEIQIRTREMDDVARSGIAAHWSYKEGKPIDEKTGEIFAWLQNLVENQANFRNPEEFMEGIRLDLYPDEVHVFTPGGDVKVLPKGATPVDFAYAVHSQVGDRCCGAKVNGRIVQLEHELNNGDRIEIITSVHHKPSRDWLNSVKTAKAKAKIRQYFRMLEDERSLSLGKEVCEGYFRKKGVAFASFLKSEDMPKAIESLGCRNLDDLLIQIGFGKLTPGKLFKKLVPVEEEEQASSIQVGSIIKKFMSGISRKKKSSGTTGVLVSGMDDVLMRFGKCCQPLPGDPIMGYITHGQGITIHSSSCPQALAMNPERRIDAEWDTDAKSEPIYPVQIRVSSSDRVGLLAEISTEISKLGANISKFGGETKDGMVEIDYFISVKNLAHLNNILSNIGRLPSVSNARRIYS
ncbi:RelA/SpoT family protein [Desulforegula conservatrix]|uniref:RelA/SpoT family protein n=1 Tax=Desulforegula conservatrix TaxID=153026 RepID=UPI0004226F2A|nr:bifunctional (p)ppGpp synthetase/guanosine-3',5'-bis(diphosphate) 3'-pyrophosphohydrolase [Desulforegula conservatrix]